MVAPLQRPRNGSRVPIAGSPARESSAEELDVDDGDAWTEERASRGRKPAAKKHRRPKSDDDENDF